MWQQLIFPFRGDAIMTVAPLINVCGYWRNVDEITVFTKYCIIFYVLLLLQPPRQVEDQLWPAADVWASGSHRWSAIHQEWEDALMICTISKYRNLQTKPKFLTKTLINKKLKFTENSWSTCLNNIAVITNCPDLEFEYTSGGGIVALFTGGSVDFKSRLQSLLDTKTGVFSP